MSPAPAAPAAESDAMPAEAVAATDERSSVAAESTIFYGWLMLPLATMVMIASSPGQTFGFSFFNPQLLTALSITKTQLSATYLFATLLAAVPLSYVGALTDRFGLRRSLLATVAAMSVACLFAASVQNVAMLFVMFVVMRMIGPGALVLLANNTIAAWFDRRLGVASGAMQLGMAGAVAFIPISTLALIEAFGWRQAYVVLAGLLALGLLPILWWRYRECPSHVGQLPDGAPQVLPGVPIGPESHHANAERRHFTLRDAMKTHSYWILIVATGAWALIGTGIVFHMEALFVSRGLTKSTAAWAPTLMAIGMATMQASGGMLADRIAVRWLVVAAMGGIAASCAGAAVSEGRGLLAAFGVYGCAQGLMTVLAGTAWARFYGRVHLGKIRGTVLTAAIAASSSGPLMMGVSADYLGGFEPSLWLFSALAATVALAGFWVTAPTDPTAPAARQLPP